MRNNYKKCGIKPVKNTKASYSAYKEIQDEDNFLDDHCNPFLHLRDVSLDDMKSFSYMR